MNIRFAVIVLALAVCGLQAQEDGENLVRNADFKEQNKYWQMNPGTTFQDGIATVPLTNVRKKDPNTVTASVVQGIPSIKPGKYEFTAYYKGEFRNLFVVFRGYTKDKKPVNIVIKWLHKKDFVKAGDKPGWYKFFYVGTVPADVVRASLHIEPWGSKGQTMQITGIELAEAE